MVHYTMSHCAPDARSGDTSDICCSILWRKFSKLTNTVTCQYTRVLLLPRIKYLLPAYSFCANGCVLQLKQRSKDDTKQGALMHVTVEGAQARLMVLPSDEVTTQSALDFITQVDPPSQGVPMRQVRPCPNACWKCSVMPTSLALLSIHPGAWLHGVTQSIEQSLSNSQQRCD